MIRTSAVDWEKLTDRMEDEGETSEEALAALCPWVEDPAKLLRIKRLEMMVAAECARRTVE